MNKKEFTVNDEKVFVHSVTPNVQTEASRIYSQAFGKALSDGVPLRLEAERMLKDKGVFDPDKDEKERAALQKEIRENEVALRRGTKPNGTKMTKSEGKELAFKIKKLRDDLDEIGSGSSALFNNTVESQASNAQLQFCIYSCTCREDGQRYWSTFETFQNDTENPVYSKAIENFLLLVSGLDALDSKRPYEDVWLIRMGFMNEDGQLIREDGKAVDEEGRLINEEGRFIDEDGNFVDAYGYKIDKDGNLLEEDGWETD